MRGDAREAKVAAAEMKSEERLYRAMNHMDPRDGDVTWEELEPEQQEYWKRIARAALRDREAFSLAVQFSYND